MSEPKTSTGQTYAGTLAERLHRAALAMPDVEKTGRNASFQYAYIEDVNLTAAARKALLEAGVVVIQSIEKIDRSTVGGEGKTRFQTLVTWKFTLTAPGTQDQKEVQWVSEALDSGDKGISKCATMARKDFFRTLLLVPGGAENEADEDTDRAERPSREAAPTPPTEAQRSFLRRLARDAGREVAVPATSAEASKLIDELKAEVETKKRS
jgi:hypothetical protein